MYGSLYSVWSELLREVWIPLGEVEDAPEDLFAEIYREIAKPPVPPVSPAPNPDAYDSEGNLFRPGDIAAEEDYKKALADFDRARATYEEAVVGAGSVMSLDSLLRHMVTTEIAAVSTFEKVARAIEALEIETVHNRFFTLAECFIEKFSLRYDLRRPFSLHPTLPGIFASLLRDLGTVAKADPHLFQLLREFEDSIRDLKGDCSAGRIKTCLQKQFNLAEALGQKCPGVTGITLGDICNQLTIWPHRTIKEALRKLYGFRSDYPGLGHAGNPNAVLREIEMKDLVAVSVVLAGYMPYLCHELNSDVVFKGA